MSNRRETSQLLKKVEKQGFDVKRTGSGHWKVTHPEREGSVVVGFSSSARGLQQTIKRLRQLGYQEGTKR